MPPAPASAPASFTAPLRLSRAAIVLPIFSAVVLLGGALALEFSPRQFEREALLGYAAACAFLTTIALAFLIRASRALAKTGGALNQHRHALLTTLPKLQEIWDRGPLSVLLLDPNDPNVPIRIVDCNLAKPSWDAPV